MKLFKNMKKTAANKTEKLSNKISNVGQKTRMLGIALSTALLTGYTNVYATNVDANQAWNNTMDTVLPWIQRIGVVLIVFGGIEFAIANSSEDVNQKTRATRFMISGAIVLAVVTAVGPLLHA